MSKQDELRKLIAERTKREAEEVAKQTLALIEQAGLQPTPRLIDALGKPALLARLEQFKRDKAAGMYAAYTEEEEQS